ncbi:MAG: tyrosine-type recombinase/integrase [Acidimicrobiales bacterium]
MATIRERRPGVWEVRGFAGRDESGRPVQISKTVRGTKKDAQRVAAEMTMRPSTVAARRLSVAEMLDLWAETEAPTWAPSTERDQLSRIRRVKSDRIASLPLSRLSAVEVDRWHARLVGRGVGEGSIKNQHTALRAAITLAVRWGWLTTNVVAVARLGRRKSEPRGTLSIEEVRRVLAAAESLVAEGQIEPHGAMALRLAAVTGARRSELAALRWRDLADGRLTIDSSIAIIRNAAGSPTLRDDPTKTANRRVIALDATTVRLLEELQSDFGALGPWILSSGEAPVNPERVTAWWRRSRNRAGVAARWRLHDLRHWSATISIARGHDIRTVANRLGHANPSMTLRTYAHAVDSTDAPIAAALGSVLDAHEVMPTDSELDVAHGDEIL